MLQMLKEYVNIFIFFFLQIFLSMLRVNVGDCKCTTTASTQLAQLCIRSESTGKQLA